jgi:hypothetical protein
MHILARTHLRFATFGAAALTAMVAAAVPAQGLPTFIGLQEDGVNGGAITIFTGPQNSPYGTFIHTNNSLVANAEEIPPTPTLPLLSGDTIDVSVIPGTLVVWMTVTGNLGVNLPLGTQAFESSFRQNLLPTVGRYRWILSSIPQTACSPPPFRCRATCFTPPTRPLTRLFGPTPATAFIR